MGGARRSPKRSGASRRRFRCRAAARSACTSRSTKPPSDERSRIQSRHNMSLAPGQRLGPYEVQAALGAGGMGEVYRARDTRLGRDIALKILPDLFAADSDRIARFEREAHLL